MRRLPLLVFSVGLTAAVGIFAISRIRAAESDKPRPYAKLDLRPDDSMQQILQKCKAAGLEITSMMGSGPMAHYTSGIVLSDGRSIGIVSNCAAGPCRNISVRLYEPDEKRRSAGAGR